MSIEYKARQRSVSVDYKTGKKLITFLIEEGFSDEAVNACNDKDLTVKIKDFRLKRSKTANAYYWELIGQLAKKLNISTSEAHNMMLGRYGVIEPGYSALIPDTDTDDKKVRMAETYHLKPTSEVSFGPDGNRYRTYLILRGSHEYNSSEFRALIEGLISECKEVGIPTETPQEIERMMQLYGKR